MLHSLFLNRVAQNLRISDDSKQLKTSHLKNLQLKVQCKLLVI